MFLNLKSLRQNCQIQKHFWFSSDKDGLQACRVAEMNNDPSSQKRTNKWYNVYHCMEEFQKKEQAKAAAAQQDSTAQQAITAQEDTTAQ